MPLSKTRSEDLKEVLRESLRRKFRNYNPEPSSMPFHTRLLGSDRMALFSFIHSLNTNFGTSIFEPVALKLSSPKFKFAELHCKAGKKISSEAHNVIQNIMNELSTADRMPDKHREIESIRKVCTKGEMRSVKLTNVDIKLVDKTGCLYLIDLKTAKPNAGNFKEFKRTLLEWVASILADDPDVEIQTLIAIPYNPYEPKPYARWTIRGMLDLDNELKVADEFWNFLGGDGTYQSLLNIFEQVGIELREEVDDYFARFRR